MMYPLVLDVAADGVPVTVSCRVLGFSTQAFYKWRKTPLIQRDWDDAHLINAALAIHGDDPAFGYRFIADELPARGIVARENRVARLWSQESIWSIFAKKRGLNRRSGPPVHDDLVDRQFRADRRDEVWLTDITEHRTDEGKLYLCAIKDVYSNRIVGYSIDSRMKASLAVSALDHAIATRSSVATIVHSDRGSQFRSRKFVHALLHNGLRGLMGRVGACGDNAAMASFFALLQRNVLDRQRWATRAELRLAVVTWIERTHHRRRRQRTLGKLTPIEFELLHRPVATAAWYSGSVSQLNSGQSRRTLCAGRFGGCLTRTGRRSPNVSGSLVDLRQVVEDTTVNNRIDSSDALRQFCRHTFELHDWLLASEIDEAAKRASKSALDMLTVLYAKELAAEGIPGASVSPGYRATGLNRGQPTPGAATRRAEIDEQFPGLVEAILDAHARQGRSPSPLESASPTSPQNSALVETITSHIAPTSRFTHIRDVGLMSVHSELIGVVHRSVRTSRNAATSCWS